MADLRSRTQAFELSGELRDSLDDSTRRSLVEGLEDLELLKAAVKTTNREIEKAEAPYRQWLADHPGEELVDGEKGIVARLKSGGTNHVYDLPSAIEARAPALYRRLLELGCLAWDQRRIEQAIKDGLLSAGDVMAFRTTGENTPRFYVEKTEGKP